MHVLSLLNRKMMKLVCVMLLHDNLLPLHQKNHVVVVMMNSARMIWTETKMIQILDLVCYCWRVLETVNCRKVCMYKYVLMQSSYLHPTFL